MVFLVTAGLCRRSLRFKPYWQIAYAFFVAAMVNLVSDLFAGYNGRMLNLTSALIFHGTSYSADKIGPVIL